jgi:hypothetical protein
MPRRLKNQPIPPKPNDNLPKLDSSVSGMDQKGHTGLTSALLVKSTHYQLRLHIARVAV